MISVVLADAHPGVLNQLAERLGRESSIRVVDRASSGEQALASILALHPDVLIFDPGRAEDGLFLPEVRVIRAQQPELQIIALAPYVDTYLNLELRKAGVNAVLNKALKTDELIAAIRKVVGNNNDNQPG
jgi:DNA-binding NarL/FixJ family response regulator